MQGQGISNRRELATLPVTRMQDVLLARFVGREQARQLGFPPAEVTHIATAISEITRNVVQHAQAPGRIQFAEVRAGGRCGLEIVVDDEGRGIERVDRLLAGGGAPAGAGIPGCQRLMDEFQIRARQGGGTSVSMLKWLGSEASAGARPR